MPTINEIIDQYMSFFNTLQRSKKETQSIGALVQPYLYQLFQDSFLLGHSEAKKDLKTAKPISFSNPLLFARKRDINPEPSPYDGSPSANNGEFFNAYLEARTIELSKRYEDSYKKLVKQKIAAYGKGALSKGDLQKELDGSRDQERQSLIEKLKQYEAEERANRRQGVNKGTRDLFVRQWEVLGKTAQERDAADDKILRELVDEYGSTNRASLAAELRKDVQAMYGANVDSLSKLQALDTVSKRASVTLSAADKKQVQRLINNPKRLQNFDLDNLTITQVQDLQSEVRRAAYGVKPGMATPSESPQEQLKRVIDYETSAAYNLGRLQSFIQNGVDYVEWASTLDTRTSLYCQSLNGRIFSIAELSKIRNVQRFVDTRKPYSVEGALNFIVPPAHPYCRSFLRPIKLDETNKQKEKEMSNRLKSMGVAIKNKDANTIKKIVSLTGWLSGSYGSYMTVAESLSQFLKGQRVAKEEVVKSSNKIISLLLGGSLVFGTGIATYFLFRDNINEAATATAQALTEFFTEKGVADPRAQAEELVQNLIGDIRPTISLGPLEEEIMAEKVLELVPILEKQGADLAKLVVDNKDANPGFLRRVLTERASEGLNLHLGLEAQRISNLLKQIAVDTWGMPFDAIGEVRREAIGYRVIKNRTPLAKLWRTKGMRSVLAPLDTNYDERLLQVQQQIAELEEKIDAAESINPQLVEKLKLAVRELRAKASLTTDQLPDVRTTDYVPPKVEVEIRARSERLFVQYQNALSEAQKEYRNVFDAIIGEFNLNNLSLDYIRSLPSSSQLDYIQQLRLKKLELEKLINTDSLEVKYSSLRKARKKVRGLGGKVLKDNRFNSDYNKELESQETLLKDSMRELLDSINTKLSALT